MLWKFDIASEILRYALSIKSQIVVFKHTWFTQETTNNILWLTQLIYRNSNSRLRLFITVRLKTEKVTVVSLLVMEVCRVCILKYNNNASCIN